MTVDHPAHHAVSRRVQTANPSGISPMLHFLPRLRRLVSLMHREDIFKVLGIVLLIAVLGAMGLVYFETGLSLANGLWWANSAPTCWHRRPWTTASRA